VDEKLRAQVDAGLSGWSDPVARLKAALEKDEFAVFCQPILALRGAPGFPMAETLVRLREEESAMLPPGDFLPVFEHHGMMPQLDRWVVRCVLRHLRKGSRMPRFTINLSSQTMDDAGFAAFVGAELKASGVPAAGLAFELDESDLLGKPQAAARFAAAIRAAGCAVLLDSFGRRSVSFAALESVRADFIKVDGSIIRKLLTSDSAAKKLDAILRVGEAIGVGVVAECVEEQPVLARLKALGVGYAQGFGINRPYPIESLAR
jgi:EAL domain-containing protein (putative c-di-GMP-specific phosphodiesterase class I)